MSGPEPLSTTLLETDLDIDVQHLWLATMADSRFARGFQERRQYRDIKRGHWRTQTGEQGIQPSLPKDPACVLLLLKLCTSWARLLHNIGLSEQWQRSESLLAFLTL